MQDRGKPTNAIAFVYRRSFRPGFHWASGRLLWQNLCIDSVCANVAALAMVGANIGEAPDTVLERL